jgi:hypothetical protein
MRVPLAAPLEELNGALVLLGSGTRCERAEILAALRAWIDLARIQPVLTVWKFSDHGVSKPNPCPRRNRRNREPRVRTR